MPRPFDNARYFNRAMLAIRWNKTESTVGSRWDKDGRFDKKSGKRLHLAWLPVPSQGEGKWIEATIVSKWEQTFKDLNEAAFRSFGIPEWWDTDTEVAHISDITRVLAVSDDMVTRLVTSGFIDESKGDGYYQWRNLQMVSEAILRGDATTSNILTWFNATTRPDRNPRLPGMDTQEQELRGVDFEMTLHCVVCGTLLGGTIPHRDCEQTHGPADFFLTWLNRVRQYQEDCFDIKYSELEGEKFATYMQYNALAAFIELGELMQEIPWKPWAAKRGKPEEAGRRKAVTEAVDVLHFIGNMLVALDVTPDEINYAYGQKLMENYARRADPTYQGRAKVKS